MWIACSLSLVCVAAFRGPMNGAPFERPEELPPLPSQQRDEEATDVFTYRKIQRAANVRDSTACDLGENPSKEACLDAAARGRECMFVRTETRNPMLAVQASTAECLPCMIEETEIPCWNLGAFVGGEEVMECEMRCPHQKRIRQPEWTCSDESGFITNAQCFDRGAKSGSKCMYTEYTIAGSDEKRSACGPCFVTGTGGFGCPASGASGPFADSSLSFCLSQCDELCAGPPNCLPTIAPPPLPPPPSAGMVKVTADADEMVKAPSPAVPMPTVNPYAIAQAAAEAAKKAGWDVGTPAPPPSYVPVIMYRRPQDYAMTPGPPPSIMAAPAYPAFLAKAVHHR
jgi:hypothetical protein